MARKYAVDLWGFLCGEEDLAPGALKLDGFALGSEVCSPYDELAHAHLIYPFHVVG